MKNILFALTISCLHYNTAAAQQVLIDKKWYLAGDKLTMAVEVDKEEAASKVAYVELCDTAAMQASAIIALKEGRGQATVSLPQNMHSGYYMLYMYTRTGKKAMKLLVPVINVLQKSANDDIQWVSTTTASYASSETQKPETWLLEPGNAEGETDGHRIYARVHNNGEGFIANLSVVGNEVHLFQGKNINDSTVVFNTYDVFNSHPVVLTAETSDGRLLPVEILNPFATLLPKTLPHLAFHYNRAEVEQRSLIMQQTLNDSISQQSSNAQQSQQYRLLGTTPAASYNLDEYRQFRTVREVLLEYVSFVHRTEKDGQTRLFVSSNTSGYSEYPALVLLDGMPVLDIERLMKYDARRVHYIYIYDDFYTFGTTTYNGIVNIITRTANLTNYPPEQNAAYLIYNFPQR